MNLKEINRMIASLQEEGLKENSELISFYKMKREQLIALIKKDVSKKLKEIA